MNTSILFFVSLVVFAAILLLITKIFLTKSKGIKVLCADILSIQCLGLSILLAIYGMGSIALQFGLALALLGFVSTIILSNVIRS